MRDQAKSGGKNYEATVADGCFGAACAPELGEREG